jgi:parvulin-like peptidyl-prolyl isomerase
MSKQRATPRKTKKYLARAQRERLQKRWILGVTFFTTVLVVGVLAYGIVNVLVVQPLQPVAIVDGESITTREFQTRVRFALAPGSESLSTGASVLDEMIDEVVIRREAERLGIVITDEDVDRAIRETFGYFPEGTPTAVPTSTMDPTAQALATATSTPTTGPSPTPAPTSTPYTQEAFEANFVSLMEFMTEEYGATEKDYRAFFETQLYREKFLETFDDDVPRVQEQVKLRHIQVEEQENAVDALDRLQAGEKWEDLVVELSHDSATLDSDGDLGWYTQDMLTERFGEEALTVFTRPLNEILGPLETSQGWHLIQAVEREQRPLTDLTYLLAVQSAMDEWLSTKRQSVDIEIFDYWVERVPAAPTPSS